MNNISPFSGSPSLTPNPYAPTPLLASARVYSNNNQTVDKPQPRPAPTKPKRKRVNTAEKRSQHNAVERARRETLNGKFIHLARLLPTLASSRRPSKAAIVNGSIKHLESTRAQRLLAVDVLRKVIAERDELLAENNTWRKSTNMAPRTVANVTKDVAEICSVEAEQFGTFANMDGNDDEEEENQETDSSFDNAFPGLITPRSAMEDFATQLFAPTSQASLVVPTPAQPLSTPVWAQDFNNFSQGLNTDRSSSGSPGARVLTPHTDVYPLNNKPDTQQDSLNSQAMALWQQLVAQNQFTSGQQTSNQNSQNWMNYFNQVQQLSPNSLDNWKKTHPNMAQGLGLQLGNPTYWPHPNQEVLEGF